jgi:glutathione S-transferase
VADINVAEVVRYADGTAELFKAAPRVKAWFEACRARPAYKKMWDAREKESA